MAATDHDIQLRSARPDDARFVWGVNNHPTVRARAVSTESIPWERHVAWFQRVLDDPSRLLYVVVVDGSDCGTIRFDLEPESRSAYVSVALAPEVRGKGIGTDVIREASRTLSERGGIDHVLAEIRPDNAPSLKAFDRAGYRPAGRKERDGVVLEILSWNPRGNHDA